MTFWPLAHSTWGNEEISAARRVLESGKTTMGVCVEKFEQEFARYHGMPYAIMVNSGSSANLIAVAALSHRKPDPLQPGDVVTVPAIAWATTYAPLLQHGLDLYVADVELDTLNIDMSHVDTNYSPRPRAIIGVSILGNPAPLSELQEYAKANGMMLMEDNCESLDALADFDNGVQRCGTFGDISTFSFFYSHHISTMEGGMILTHDERLAMLCRSLRNHGWTRGIPGLQRPLNETDDDLKRDERYEFVLPGYNVRPLEICGAIGLEQMKKLPAMTRQRRKNWKLFQHLFANDDRFIIQRETGISSAFAFTMICRNTKDRPRVLDILRQKDIGVRMITGGNFLRHPIAETFRNRISQWPCQNADKVHDAGFFVGNHPYDLEKQLYKLKEILR